MPHSTKNLQATADRICTSIIVVELVVVLVVPLISLFEPCRRRLIHSVTSLIDWILRSKRQHDEWRFLVLFPRKKNFFVFCFFLLVLRGVVAIIDNLQKTGRPPQPNQGVAVTSPSAVVVPLIAAANSRFRLSLGHVRANEENFFPDSSPCNLIQKDSAMLLFGR